MEKFKKKLIICAVLLLACVAYQFIFDQILHEYYLRYHALGTYAMFLLIGIVKPLQYFLIGFVVILLYQNIFSTSPQPPSKFKPVCKFAAGGLVAVCAVIVILWGFGIDTYPLNYYIFNHAYLFILLGALWQLGCD